MLLEVPIHGIRLTTTHGAHVLVIYDDNFGAQGCSDIRVFDFSRGGITALPLSGGSDGGTERMAAFKGGRSCMFARHGEYITWRPRSLGDSVASWIVSPTSHPTGGWCCRLIYRLDTNIQLV